MIGAVAATQSERDIALDCIDVATRFFHWLDRCDYENLVELFSPEAQWCRQGETLKGRAAILKAMAARSRALTTRHFLLNPVVEIIGLSNVSVGYDVSVFSQEENSSPRHVQILTGSDEFVCIGSRWLIALKAAKPIFVFQPLLHDAQAALSWDRESEKK